MSLSWNLRKRNKEQKNIRKLNEVDGITLLNVGHVLPNGRIYGPGVRFVLWLQGCTLGCKGCWNQQFWPAEGGVAYDIEELIKQIIDAKQK